jgi:hypothetical protein
MKEQAGTLVPEHDGGSAPKSKRINAWDRLLDDIN